MNLDSTALKTAVCSGNYAYLQIPTDSLHGFYDHMFPGLAINRTADIAQGYMHRWTAGHDLLIDVPQTLVNKGLGTGMKHAGHILLTDFPTKHGIPIPGLSGSGLGKFLTETCGIPKAYLCLNVMDTTVGILAMSEGTLDMINVVFNTLRMSPGLFFDTFVEGAAEIAGGCCCTNPLLLISGAENIGAGLIATYNTVTRPLWYVNPVDFFSGCLSGGILALLVSKYVLKKDGGTSVKAAFQSTVMGGLFALSTGFGIGGLAALLCSGIGRMVAEKDNVETRRWFMISERELALMGWSAELLLGDMNDIWYFGSCRGAGLSSWPEGCEYIEVPWFDESFEKPDFLGNLLGTGVSKREPLPDFGWDLL